MRALLSVFVVGLIAGPISAQAPHRTSTSAAISADDLRARLFLIADDSMLGRQPGEAGNYKTAEYVAGEFKRLGLEPAGENGTYFQTVPFVLMAADSGSFLEAGGTRLTLGQDLLLVGPATTVRSISNAPVMYGGPVRDPSQWASGDSAVGKVVVLDVRPGPDGARNARGLGDHRSQVQPGGAHRHRQASTSWGASSAPPSWRGRLTVNSTLNATAAPRAFISDKAASALLGGDPSTMTPGRAGRTVNGSVGYASRQVAYAARNVVAVLRGSDPKLRGTYVALTAHNDHVGFDHSPRSTTIRCARTTA